MCESHFEEFTDSRETNVFRFFASSLCFRYSLYMDGILRCSRYAFGPNRLHYCGPDANKTVRGYIGAGESDLGLSHILSKFQTLYPYLKRIAAASRIADPFDDRVVEAYWIGNTLLDRVPCMRYIETLEMLGARKLLGGTVFSRVGEKLSKGGIPHHSFHVMNIWIGMKHEALRQDWSSLGECLVSWGKVLSVSGPFVTVETEPLSFDEKHGTFLLGAPTERKLVRNLSGDIDMDLLSVGEWITFHWGVPCEVIPEVKVRHLRSYTLRSIALANMSL